jgi:hypothetical protein
MPPSTAVIRMAPVVTASVAQDSGCARGTQDRRCGASGFSDTGDLGGASGSGERCDQRLHPLTRISPPSTVIRCLDGRGWRSPGHAASARSGPG